MLALVLVFDFDFGLAFDFGLEVVFELVFEFAVVFVFGIVRLYYIGFVFVRYWFVVGIFDHSIVFITIFIEEFP